MLKPYSDNVISNLNKIIKTSDSTWNLDANKRTQRLFTLQLK